MVSKPKAVLAGVGIVAVLMVVAIVVFFQTVAAYPAVYHRIEPTMHPEEVYKMLKDEDFQPLNDPNLPAVWYKRAAVGTWFIRYAIDTKGEPVVAVATYQIKHHTVRTSYKRLDGN